MDFTRRFPGQLLLDGLVTLTLAGGLSWYIGTTALRAAELRTQPVTSLEYSTADMRFLTASWLYLSAISAGLSGIASIGLVQAVVAADRIREQYW